MNERGSPVLTDDTETARCAWSYVASPNRIGHEDEPGTNGITFFGHSFISDPFGRVIAEAGTEAESDSFASA